MKLAFAAGALTLMTIAATSATPAAAQMWRGGYSHSGYGQNVRAASFAGRGYGVGMRRYGGYGLGMRRYGGYGLGLRRFGYGYGAHRIGYGGYGYARRAYGAGYGYVPRYYGGGYGGGYGYTPRSYGGGYGGNGYSHTSAYNAGFNRGAEVQWSVDARWRWAYDYAVYRAINGPSGIFAGLGGGYGYGGRVGFSGGYGYGGCNC